MSTEVLSLQSAIRANYEESEGRIIARIVVQKEESPMKLREPPEGGVRLSLKCSYGA